MASWEDVRRIVAELPETVAEPTGDGVLSWRVRRSLVAWERPLRRADREALGAAAPTEPPLAAYVPDLGAKEALLADDPQVYFTTPHFDGYPVVLVRLDRIDPADLTELLTESWLTRAPKRLAKAYLENRS